MDTRKQFDISREELRREEERNKRRNILRQDYLRQIENPYRPANSDGYLIDPGMQRYMAARVTAYEHFRPTAKNGLMSFGAVIVPTLLFAWLLKSSRDAWEHKYRTGQISYAERRGKFV